jgi:hypothetical protein
MALGDACQHLAKNEVHKDLPADPNTKSHRSKSHFGDVFGKISIGVHDVFSVEGLIEGCGAR